MKVILVLAVLVSVASVLRDDVREAPPTARLNELRAGMNGVNASGAFVVGRRPTFLIALGNPPPLEGTTPTGLGGPVEIARTGVNLVRVGPAWEGWTPRRLAHALAWQSNRGAARHPHVGEAERLRGDAAALARRRSSGRGRACADPEPFRCWTRALTRRGRAVLARHPCEETRVLLLPRLVASRTALVRGRADP